MSKKKTDEELINEYEQKLKDIHARQDKLVLRYLKNTKNENGENRFETVLKNANEWNENRKTKKSYSDQNFGNEYQTPSEEC